MKKVSLIKAAPFSGKRVRQFDGTKNYLSTGDLKGSDTSFKKVTYSGRPSRADITVYSGDVLFARMKSTKKVLLITEELSEIIVSTGFAVLRPNNNTDGKYLYFYLKSDEFERQKEKYCSGAIQPAITNGGIKDLIIPLPLFKDQKRIAFLLEKVEGLIAKRKEHLKQLDELLKSVFLEMFGDPVKNEKGWDTLSFNNVGRFISGATPSKDKDEFWNGNFPWVSPKDMKFSKIIDSIDQISELAFKTTSLKRISPGHLLIVVRGMILAHSFPVAINNVEIAINQDMKAIKLNKGINVEYLKNCLVSQNRQILKLITTAGHGTRKFDSSAMKKLYIPIPPEKLQKNFATIVEKIESLKTYYKSSLSNLENLYGTLSQKAFKDELDLKNIPLYQNIETDSINSEEKVGFPTINLDPKDEFISILTKPTDIKKLNNANCRTKILEGWLQSWFEKPGNKIFDTEVFMEKAHQTASEWLEDNITDWGAQDYEVVKKWIFNAIKNDQIEQTRNAIKIDNELELGNRVILKKA